MKAINPLHFSAEQMQAVLGILKPGMQKLQQQDQANAKLMAPVIPQLRQTAAQPNMTLPRRNSRRDVRGISNLPPRLA